MKKAKNARRRLRPVLDAIAAVNQPDSHLHDFTIWQILDSAFPTGGFAHSSGLEAATQYGEVLGRTDLASFVEAGLDQLGHGSLPFVLAAFDSPEKLVEYDSLYEVFMTNHVANRASRAQGRAFLAAMGHVFDPQLRIQNLELPFTHFAPAFGLCLRRLHLAREKTGRMFLFNHLRSVLASAVRLNIVGPMEAQTMQYRFAARAEMILKRCSRLTLDEVAQTSPLLDLWQSAQDRLYSRLFQS